MALEWKGDEVYTAVESAAITGLTEFGARHETASKGRVSPGRGVVTGTYRRSIHYGKPSYNFGRDNVRPSGNSPDRSGKGGGATRKGDTVAIVVGSGMVYAKKLEDMYSPIQGGFDQVKGQLPDILRKHAIANGLKP